MKKYFSGPALLCALLAFLLFVVAACAAYYWTAGVFVTARLAFYMSSWARQAPWPCSSAGCGLPSFST